jgi:hypothetical protein
MDDPPRLRVVGGEADAEAEQLHPEVAEFVRWFTSWWFTRGLEFPRTKRLRSSVPPEPSPRAVAYVRESTEKQGQGFSPDAQREAIRTFAAENRLALVGEYCDFHSGWKRANARPEFQRPMADAAERRFDCVLVYPSRSTRCSTSTCRSRSRSGRGPAYARRRGRDTSSVRSRGVTCVTPRPQLRTIVLLKVKQAAQLTSPAYDAGASDEVVAARWERHLAEILRRRGRSVEIGPQDRS